MAPRIVLTGLAIGLAWLSPPVSTPASAQALTPPNCQIRTICVRHEYRGGKKRCAEYKEERRNCTRR